MSTFLEALDALTGKFDLNVSSPFCIYFELRGILVYSVYFPAVYNDGEVHGVGPSIFALIPLLSHPSLQYQSILELILKLLHMLSKKDLLAIHAILDDCIQLFLDLCSELLAGLDSCTSHKFLPRFGKLMHSNDRNKYENSSVLLFKSDQERNSIASALRSISSYIIGTMGQTLSDKLDVQIWRNICNNLMHGTTCIKQESRDLVIILSLRLLVSVCAEIQLPRTASEQVRFGDTELPNLRFSKNCRFRFTQHSFTWHVLISMGNQAMS